VGEQGKQGTSREVLNLETNITPGYRGGFLGISDLQHYSLHTVSQSIRPSTMLSGAVQYLSYDEKRAISVRSRALLPRTTFYKTRKLPCKLSGALAEKSGGFEDDGPFVLLSSPPIPP
jgi:hypothetical protein